jgi:hypothetical protein
MQNIDALRSHLFGALEALSDKVNPMEIERAKAISEVAQTIINSAKVEVDFMRKAGSDDMPRFLKSGLDQVTSTKHGTKEISGPSTIHRIAG